MSARGAVDRRERVHALNAAGLSPADIAARVGYSLDHVRELTRGARESRKQAPDKRWSAEEVQKLETLISEGGTFAQAAAELGRNRNMCIGVVHRAKRAALAGHEVVHLPADALAVRETARAAALTHSRAAVKRGAILVQEAPRAKRTEPQHKYFARQRYLINGQWVRVGFRLTQPEGV
jgi:hypothetical protein